MASKKTNITLKGATTIAVMEELMLRVNKYQEHCERRDIAFDSIAARDLGTFEDCLSWIMRRCEEDFNGMDVEFYDEGDEVGC